MQPRPLGFHKIMQLELSVYLLVSLIYLQPCLFSSDKGKTDRETLFQTREVGRVKLYSSANELFVDGKLVSLSHNIIVISDNITAVGNSGSDSNPGTEIQPFKTITHARDAIREMKSRGTPSFA